MSNTELFEINAKLERIEDSLKPKKTEKYLEPGLTININQVEKINRSKAGKIQHFFSEL